MGKVIFCKDLGINCGWAARADTEEELLKRVADHAASTHGIKELSEEVIAKGRAAICDEKECSP
jgi:predicted small metal-binding protein